MKTKPLSKESLLTIACCSGWVEDIRKLLADDPNFDIACKDGKFFGLAIVADDGSPEMLEIFVDHYKKTKMQGDFASEEYQLARERLLDILYTEGDTTNVAPKIRAVLDKYLHEGESDKENDFEGFEDLRLSDDENDIENDDNSRDEDSASAHASDNYLPLTEENLDRLNKANSMISTDSTSPVTTPKTLPDLHASYAKDEAREVDSALLGELERADIYEF